MRMDIKRLAGVCMCSVAALWCGSTAMAQLDPPTSRAQPEVTPAPTSTPDRGEGPMGVNDALNMFGSAADEDTGAEPDAADAGDDAVQIGALGEIDLHVKDLDVTKVLQLLSIQSQRNIVASKNVSGKVSADLYNVSFDQAMDAILEPNGFAWRERGNFIYVYTAQEIQDIDEAGREVEARVIRLNYLDAQTASTMASSLLSPNGTIAISGESAAGFQPSIGDGGGESFAFGGTLMVRDYEENVEQIAALVQELDTRPKQVLVEATVLQARLTEDNAFGVDFAVFSDLTPLDFANPLNAVNSLISGGGPTGETGGAIGTTAGGSGSNRAGIKAGYLGSDAAVFARALDAVADTTVLATPKVLVLNRQRADILVGERLGYLSTTVTETSETQTVEFLDVGTQLTVRPFITDEGFIRLELRPSVSDGTTRSVGNTVIPDQTTQELVTNVIVRDGTTVVLGGLFKEDVSISRSQIPGLGEIPGLGWLGKGQDDEIDRSEVIFLIKVTVMEDGVLADMGDSAMDEIENTRLAVRQGLLPWSNDKLAKGYLREARESMSEGRDKRALYQVNMALYSDPGSREAVELKERLNGEFEPLSNGMLQDVINSVIDEELAQTPTVAPVAARPTGLEPPAATPPAPRPASPNRSGPSAAISTDEDIADALTLDPPASAVDAELVRKANQERLEKKRQAELAELAARLDAMQAGVAAKPVAAADIADADIAEEEAMAQREMNRFIDEDSDPASGFGNLDTPETSGESAAPLLTRDNFLNMFDRWLPGVNDAETPQPQTQTLTEVPTSP